MFLQRKIGYLAIVEMIAYAMAEHSSYFKQNPDLEDILETEKWTYECVKRKIVS